MSVIVYLIISGVSFCVSSQIIKMVFNMFIDGKKRINVKDFFTDGHYPSSHTSFVTGLALITWMQVFYCQKSDYMQIYIWIATIATAVAAIVIRDALGVRYTVQCLCDAVLIMIDDVKGQSKADVEKLNQIKDSLNKKNGHRPYEVIGGVVWGLQMGLLVSSIYYSNHRLMYSLMALILIFIFISFKYNKKIRKM